MTPLIEPIAAYAQIFKLTTPQGRLLVDTGALPYAPRFAAALRDFAPDALLLTHAHIDHAPNAWLAARLGLPVLAHPLELPFLLGQDSSLPYPAGRPTLSCLISRLHPKLRAKAVDAVLPGQELLGWEVVALPGHTAGQLGLYRDGALLAADAVIGQRHASGEVSAHLPRPAYNADQAQTEATLRRIATMPELEVIYPSHGPAMGLAAVRKRVEKLACGGYDHA